MNADQLDRAIRDTLDAWTPDGASAPPDIVDRIVRRRRLRHVRVAATALALTGVTFGALLATGTGDDRGARVPTSRVSKESRLLWQTTLPGESWDACTTGPGAVYCRGTAYDGISVEVGSGKVEWRRKAAAADGGSSPAGSLPGVRGGVLYTYADHAPGANRAGTDLVALDLGTRQVLWKHELADDSRNSSSAVLFDGGVLANTPGFKSVAALDGSTGRTLWTHSWKRADCERTAIGGVPYLMCSPDSEKAPQHSTVVRLDPATGEPRTVAAVDGPTTYVGTDGEAVLLGGRPDRPGGPAPLIRVDLRSGRVTQHRLAGPAGGVVVQDKLLAPGRNGRVVAYSIADGRRLWSRDLGLVLRKEARNAVMRELPSDAAVDVDRRLAFYLDPSGHLVGLDLDSGSVRWRGRVEVPDAPVQGGVAPELMVEGDTLVGQVGGQLFRVEPVLPESGR